MSDTLRLPVPPSTNNLFVNAGKRGRVKSKPYKAWLEAAGWELKIQRPVMHPRKVRLRVSCPRNIRRDLSNHLKPIEDLLVEHRIILDDRHVEHIEMYWHDGEEDSAHVFVEVIRV